MNEWEERHWDERTRIGLLVPSSNTVMENDLHRNLPGEQFTVHVARMFLEETSASAEREMIERFARGAAQELRTLKPHLTVFGCTSAGSIGGPAYDGYITNELSRAAGSEVLGVFSAARHALARRNIQKVLVLTPYVEELNRTILKGLEADGIHVQKIVGLGIRQNFSLASPRPDDIVSFALREMQGLEVDGIFLSCTNFRSFEAKEQIEAQAGVPVVTSNSAVVDAILSRRFPS